jgi:hypothetical protein
MVPSHLTPRHRRAPASLSAASDPSLGQPSRDCAAVEFVASPTPQLLAAWSALTAPAFTHPPGKDSDDHPANR